MATLHLDSSENSSLEAALAKLEEQYGTEYSFIPEIKEFSCKCSGPGQSCVWH